MDTIKRKKSLVKDITMMLEVIAYARNNYVFEDELEFEQVKEIEITLSKLWLIYLKLWDDKERKMKEG